MNLRELKIAPSLLSANFARLEEEVARVERGGCDWLHIDVMDGHFVPNITVGPFIVKAIRKITSLPLDTHLMIEHPENFVRSFVEAGSNSITVHAEACPNNLSEVIRLIHSMGVKCGVSLKPGTPLSVLEPHLKDLELVLLMTVEPGFGGQLFIPEVMQKVSALRKIFENDIQVDGGINPQTAKLAITSGANVLVAGTAIFGKPDAGSAIMELRCR